MAPVNRLVKTMTGIYQPDGGGDHFQWRTCSFSFSFMYSHALGITAIHQENRVVWWFDGCQKIFFWRGNVPNEQVFFHLNMANHGSRVRKRLLSSINAPMDPNQILTRSWSMWPKTQLVGYCSCFVLSTPKWWFWMEANRRAVHPWNFTRLYELMWTHAKRSRQGDYVHHPFNLMRFFAFGQDRTRCFRDGCMSGEGQGYQWIILVEWWLARSYWKQTYPKKDVEMAKTLGRWDPLMS